MRRTGGHYGGQGSDSAFSFNRRRLLQTSTALPVPPSCPRILAIPRALAQAGSTMVIAAPATPQSLDCNFDVSLGTFEAVAALYDNVLGFETMPDRAGRRRRCARTSRFTRTSRAR